MILPVHRNDTSGKPGPAIWWVKRDMRLCDNLALSEAIAAGHPDILPVFVEEPGLIACPDYSPMHRHAWLQALWSLRQQLRKRSSDVCVLQGPAEEMFTHLHQKIPFTHVYSHEEIGNGWTYTRDRQVQKWCQERGIHYMEYPQSGVRRGGINRDTRSQFWQKRIIETPILRTPAIVPTASLSLELAARTEIPQPVERSDLWQPVSELYAGQILQSFLQQRGVQYRGGISSPNTAFTAGSRLSPHLAWGTISLRQAYQQTLQRQREIREDADHPLANRWQRSLQNFLSRLHWRDHFIQRLESEPELEFTALHPAYRTIPYEEDGRLLAAWVNGQTGFPLVDAVMRCLSATGFVNFRMRSMVVSFACHALHLSWQLIHPPLSRIFRDYEPGIHMNQLQMQAGVVGWNAIRVYNPTKQLEEQDPEAVFVHQWLPELRDIPVERIRKIHEFPVPGYPAPIVDFASRTREMKDWLYAIRKAHAHTAETKAIYHKHGSRLRQDVSRSTTSRKRKKPTMPSRPGLFDGLEDDEADRFEQDLQ